MVKTSATPIILRMNYDSIFLFLRTLKNIPQICIIILSNKNKAHEQNYILTYYCRNHELGRLG
jgi:hypothetical protein